jgi:hypothetical protein
VYCLYRSPEASEDEGGAGGSKIELSGISV